MVTTLRPSSTVRVMSATSTPRGSPPQGVLPHDLESDAIDRRGPIHPLTKERHQHLNPPSIKRNGHLSVKLEILGSPRHRHTRLRPTLRETAAMVILNDETHMAEIP